MVRYRHGGRAGLRCTLGDLLELQPNVVRRLPTVVGILAQAYLDQTFERGRGQRLHRRNRSRLALQHRRHRAGRSLALEGPLSRYHLTQDRIVGEGYHERKGEAHAEVQALAAAGPLAAGATAVVTLEPCNHQGRTPACRQALIDAGVRRAVIAVIDPTSRGEGGVAALRQAGVDVETGVLAAEARVVLGGWLSDIKNRRPVITWPYLVGGHSIEALPGDMSEARLLRLNADAVLRADGSVREAVPGSHWSGILTVKDQPPGTGAAEAAMSLYDSGIRHLLLDGGHEVAAPFLASGLVDRGLAFVQ